MHPELSFMAMNDMRVIKLGKKNDEGFKVRYKLVKKLFPKFDFEKIRASFKRCDVADDDILDAYMDILTIIFIVDRSGVVILLVESL